MRVHVEKVDGFGDIEAAVRRIRSLIWKLGCTPSPASHRIDRDDGRIEIVVEYKCPNQTTEVLAAVVLA
jgi:hypothetical protein